MRNGALSLFSAVQLTTILGLITGYCITPRQWLGVSLAFAGSVWLVSPGVEAPSLEGEFSMVAAGVSWGILCRSAELSQVRSAKLGHYLEMKKWWAPSGSGW